MAQKKIGFSLNDVMILDPANVAGLMHIKDSFYDDGKLSWLEEKKAETMITTAKYVPVIEEEITYNHDKSVMTLNKTKVSTEYVEWFRKIAKAFNRQTPYLCFFVNEKMKDFPAIITNGEKLGMILAPRVDS